MRTATDELRESIELIKNSYCKATIESETSYALGMVHALRITYMLNKKYCDKFAEEIAKARKERLEEISN